MEDLNLDSGYEDFEQFQKSFNNEYNDVEIVTSFLIPKTRLNSALNMIGETTPYMVIPVTYPKPSKYFGEYSWLVTVCPTNIRNREHFDEWVEDIACDDFIISDEFQNLDENEKFFYCEAHDDYFHVETRFNSLDHEKVMNKVDSLISSEEWNSLTVQAWLKLRDAEQWLDKEVNGVNACDCFDLDYAEFPLEVALKEIAKKLNCEAEFQVYDESEEEEDF